MVSAQVRREQTRFAMERGLRQRRACALMQVGRSCMNYAAKMPIKNAPVIDAMRALSAQYPRFGSRRIRVMLAREGIELGKDRVCIALGQSRSSGTGQEAPTSNCGKPAPAACARG